jgi:hypothetical protein
MISVAPKNSRWRSKFFESWGLSRFGNPGFSGPDPFFGSGPRFLDFFAPGADFLRFLRFPGNRKKPKKTEKNRKKPEKSRTKKGPKTEFPEKKICQGWEATLARLPWPRRADLDFSVFLPGPHGRKKHVFDQFKNLGHLISL